MQWWTSDRSDGSIQRNPNTLLRGLELNPHLVGGM